MSEATNPYLLASSVISHLEHLKIALVATDPQDPDARSGSTKATSQSQRIFVIVSNVAQGVEQACILVIKPRNRDPSTAALLKVIPILPDLSIHTEKEHITRESTTPSSSSSSLRGLSSVQSILDRVIPDVFAAEEKRTSFTFAYGTQKASASTADTQGLKDFLTVLRDLLKLADKHSFSLVTTHQWLSAYTDDVPSLHKKEPYGQQTPVFSRFTKSAFMADKTEVNEGPRPVSPSSDEIRVSTGTFNVGGHWPYDDDSMTAGLKKWLKADEDPDLIVLGLQEADTSSGAYLYYSPAREEAWTRVASQALGRHADKYYKVASKQLVGLLILVFARSSVQDSISNVAMATASVGFGGFVANKGAVGVRFQIGQRTLCFINSHLAAFEGAQAMERRCWDWNEIYKRMRFKVALPTQDFWETSGQRDAAFSPGGNPFQTVRDAKTHVISAREAKKDRIHSLGGISPDAQNAPEGSTIDHLIDDAGHMKLDAGTKNDRADDDDSRSSSSSDPSDDRSSKSDVSMDVVEYAIMDHDVVINFGDLNFRIDLSRTETLRLIEGKDLSQLRRFDQLESLRTSHSLFDDFDEGDIDFAPTYKFDKGSDLYDTSEKMRIPAWTDRILWAVTQDWQDVDLSDLANDDQSKAYIIKQRKQGVVLQSYHSISDLKISDHRPVRATFLIRIK